MHTLHTTDLMLLAPPAQVPPPRRSPLLLSTPATLQTNTYVSKEDGWGRGGQTYDQQPHTNTLQTCHKCSDRS